LESLEGVEGFNRDAFVKAHEAGEAITSIRINPLKASIVNRESSMQETLSALHSSNSVSQKESEIHDSRFTIDVAVPWSRYGFYLKERPSFTFDPLFHAGCYYVQEASSMFLEQAFRQLVDLSKPLKVLDLCAAPGGKSTHIQSLLSAESLLVSNEIIKSRNLVLTDNMIKWGASNVIVTNNDPSAFKKLEGFFDVIVVDAPCSGSGLFRKDEEAIDEWSLNAVQLCRQRQQRILADVLPALKENGILVYATCSYSKEEDENITDWLVEEMEMKNVELGLEDGWNIVTAHSKNHCKGYRFYPHKVKGEGFFLACFQKTAPAAEPKYRIPKMERPTAKEKDRIQSWLKPGNHELLKSDHLFFVLPSALVNAYGILRLALNLHYQGTGIGQIMKDRLVPDHALALSSVISGEIPFTDLSYEQAIKYLQRQDLEISGLEKGWQLVRYGGHNLGWINVLPNRINNYYPKEFRILKQRNDSAFEK